MRRLLIIGLTLIGLQAYSQEVRWENITALHYAATGGSDLEHTLQQYLLFDLEVLNSHEQLFEQYRSFTEEFSQKLLNAKAPEGVKEIDEGIANLKQIMKEHPEMAAPLKEQISELENQRRELMGQSGGGTAGYSVNPSALLQSLTRLAVNKKAYTAYKDIGNGMFSVSEGPCYGQAHTTGSKKPSFQKGYEFSWGAINYNGRQIIAPKYDEFAEFYPEQDFIVLCTKDKNGKVCAGACGYDGRVRIPFIYDEPFQRGSFIWTDNPPKFHLYVFKKDGKYGFIGLDGEVLQPCVYVKIESGGLWSVTKDYKKYGLVDDADGRLVVPLEYKAAWMDEGIIYKKRHDGKVEVCDSNYKLIRIEDAH